MQKKASCFVTSQKGCFVIDQMVLGFIAHPDNVNPSPASKLTLEGVCTDNELNAQLYTGMDSMSFPNHGVFRPNMI